ncbi:MAG: sialidase family protein [Chitinophagaceae bacterium]
MKKISFSASVFLLMIIPVLTSAKMHKKVIVTDMIVPYKIISYGGTAGVYQAFPDACRLKNGDIVAVFYSGGAHVTYPSDKYPKCGRICLVRSKDEGRTWSLPVTVYDDEFDNKDPHISQMSDGSLVCTFFTTKFGKPIERKASASMAYYGDVVARESLPGAGPQYVQSFNNGLTWQSNATAASSEAGWNCSAEMRQLPDGTWIFPIYHQDAKEAWGGIIRSADKGKSWEAPIAIGKGSGVFLPAETDVISLKNGSLYAALRGSIKDTVLMHYASSQDMGKSWSSVKDIGFQGHSPSFTRLKNGAILLTIRAFYDGTLFRRGYSGLRISYDEAKTWEGPYRIDTTWGAYPSTIELKDGSILAIYYEEGERSRIRALRFSLPVRMKEKIPADKPVAVITLPLN